MRYYCANFYAKNRILHPDISSLDDHDAIIDIGFLQLVWDLLGIEIVIEICHLVRELLDIINDDESIRSALREDSQEIPEIFFFHRIDIHQVKKSIRETRDHRISISPDCVDIFEFTLPKIVHRIDMHIPRLLDCGDI